MRSGILLFGLGCVLTAVAWVDPGGVLLMAFGATLLAIAIETRLDSPDTAARAGRMPIHHGQPIHHVQEEAST